MTATSWPGASSEKRPFSWAPYTPSFYSRQTIGEESDEIGVLARAMGLCLSPGYLGLPEKPVYKIGDIGCGRGRFLKSFAEQGFDIWGTDGANVLPAGLVIPREKFRPQDFRDGLLIPLDLDIILCLEVLEHVPDETGREMLKKMARSKAKAVVFSAAYPGQGGTGHINERESEYWGRLFNTENRRLDRPLTRRIIEMWYELLGHPVRTCTWYESNLRVYR